MHGFLISTEESFIVYGSKKPPAFLGWEAFTLQCVAAKSVYRDRSEMFSKELFIINQQDNRPPSTSLQKIIISEFLLQQDVIGLSVALEGTQVFHLGNFTLHYQLSGGL